MIRQELESLLRQVLDQLKKEKFIPQDIELPKYTVEIPPTNISADLASNVILLISQKINKPAQEIAEKIISLLSTRSSLLAKVEFTPPGFLNFWITPERFHEELRKIIKEKENYGKINLSKGEKILFEFVSANPTGPLHVGHGRGAVIGDSLVRIFSFLGWQVEKEYYINDLGNQIANLGRTVKLRVQQVAKITLTEEEENWLNSENVYRGEYINQIAQEIFRGENLARFGEKEEEFFAQKAVKEILTWIKKELKDLGIEFDHWVRESTFYEKLSKVEGIISQLEKAGFLYKKESALWFKSTIFGDEKDRVLVRSDRRMTYLVGDLAYHQNKFERKYSKLVNLWGADHHGYAPRLKAGIKALGYSPENLEIILYQLVSLTREGKPVTMSTRAGEFITLRKLLDEVGKDACRFFFLMRSPEAHLEFDLDLAKKQSPENPVYYIQYAHTRCVSIFREAKKAGIDYKLETIDYKLLKEKAELNLIKKLVFFTDTLVSCVEDLSPHHLPVYLSDLANEFHRYYEKYRVISENPFRNEASKNLTLARLSLVETVRTVISTGLNLIGVSAPEKM